MIRGFAYCMVGLLLSSTAYSQVQNRDTELKPPRLEMLVEGQWIEVDSSRIKPSDEDDERISIPEIQIIGEQVWEIVKAGEPVIEFEQASTSALPATVQSASQLTYWKGPQSSVYRIVYENFLGVDVISFSYRLSFQYGGRHQNKGRYLSQVRIEPVEIKVLWGFNLKAFVEVNDVVNLGSQDDPIAAMQIALQWEITNPIQKNQSKVQFFVTGEGDWRLL